MCKSKIATSLKALQRTKAPEMIRVIFMPISHINKIIDA